MVDYKKKYLKYRKKYLITKKLYGGSKKSSKVTLLKPLPDSLPYSAIAEIEKIFKNELSPEYQTFKNLADNIKKAFNHASEKFGHLAEKNYFEYVDPSDFIGVNVNFDHTFTNTLTILGYFTQTGDGKLYTEGLIKDAKNEKLYDKIFEILENLGLVGALPEEDKPHTTSSSAPQEADDEADGAGMAPVSPKNLNIKELYTKEFIKDTQNEKLYNKIVELFNMLNEEIKKIKNTNKNFNDNNWDQTYKLMLEKINEYKNTSLLVEKQISTFYKRDFTETDIQKIIRFLRTGGLFIYQKELLDWFFENLHIYFLKLNLEAGMDVIQQNIDAISYKNLKQVQK